MKLKWLRSASLQELCKRSLSEMQHAGSSETMLLAPGVGFEPKVSHGNPENILCSLFLNSKHIEDK